MGRVVAVDDLIRMRLQWKDESKTVVFTNGCFDIIHRGHVEYLTKAKAFGDILVVGINSDDSVRRIKGNGRPIIPLEDRAFVLANILPVDYVCPFEEDTPLNLISRILPDVLVKGADWDLDAVVGKDVVEKHGGRVVTIELTPHQSTTNIIERILNQA